MISVPTPQPARGQMLRLAVPALLILGGLAVAVGIAAWIAAHQSTVTIDKQHPYLWRSGAAVYLAVDQFDDVRCTATTSDGATVGDVYVPGLRRISDPGRQANPLTSRPVVVSCDGEVTVSSGPVLALYRLNTLPGSLTLFLAGVVLWLRGRRFRFLAVGRLWRALRCQIRRRDRLR
ncbi:MAG: hypothetical protein E6F99_20370 [Actinobacteria bacterium]|nr:MAG: hypothetical protein E6F99_20370 [Actinomycetota bacterium]